MCNCNSFSVWRGFCRKHRFTGYNTHESHMFILLVFFGRGVRAVGSGRDGMVLDLAL